MTIIFDENVPLPLRQFLTGHVITTVQEQGWTGIENGALLSLVDGKFDLLILADKNLRYQQNLSERRIAMIELSTNRWPILKTLAPAIVTAVAGASPGSSTVIPLP